MSMTALPGMAARRLLTAWDDGAVRHPVERPLTLLTAATGDQNETLAALPLGQREQMLLLLRERVFGARITALATCPACSERVEVALLSADLRQGSPEGTLDPAALTFGLNGYQVDFRLPDTRDAAAAASSSDVDSARQVLLSRCLTVTDADGGRVAAADIPPDVVAAAGERIAELDPQADIRLLLTCPGCREAWDAPFDVGAFLWIELEAWARRTMHAVDELARAYGWSEAEILDLSERRRQAYLELAGS
jgi:hypothetical protein